MDNNSLPAPCELCEMSGGTYRFVKRDGYDFAARCTCKRGQMLADRDRMRDAPIPEHFQPLISADVAAQAVEGLSAMPFFPPAAGAQTMIANEIMALCHSPGDARWLVVRMLRLFSKWPGVPELRHVYGARKRPADGIEPVGISEYFPDGIPSERPDGDSDRRLLPAADKKRIGPVSDNQDLQNSIADLAILKGMDRPKMRPRLHDIPVNPEFQPITQADIDRAVQELHEKRAMEELGVGGE